MRLLCVIGLSLLALVSTSSFASPPCIHPAVDQLEGEWLGVGDMGSTAHLALNRYGKGRLTINEEPGSSPNSIYRVTSTRLDGYSIEFSLDPISWPPQIEVSGTSRCGYLTLDRVEIGSTRGTQRFNLQRKSLLDDSLKAVQRDPP